MTKGPTFLPDCCYDPDKAFCYPNLEVSKTVRQSPDPTRCDSRCAKIARTDEHIERIQQMIDESKWKVESEAVPLPLCEHSKQCARALESLVKSHNEDNSGAMTDEMLRESIRDAVTRRIEGRPLCPDSKLTIKSLADEAGVKRWVLTHKFTGLQDEFRTGAESTVGKPVVVLKLREQLKDREATC